MILLMVFIGSRCVGLDVMLCIGPALLLAIAADRLTNVLIELPKTDLAFSEARTTSLTPDSYRRGSYLP